MWYSADLFLKNNNNLQLVSLIWVNINLFKLEKHISMQIIQTDIH